MKVRRKVVILAFIERILKFMFYRCIYFNIGCAKILLYLSLIKFFSFQRYRNRTRTTIFHRTFGTKKVVDDQKRHYNVGGIYLK